MMRAVGALVIAMAWLAAPMEAQAADWKSVSAIFDARCTACHSGDYAPMDLQLDSHAGVMKGSHSGAVVKADDVEASLLMQRLRGKAQPRMPLDGPPFLEDAQIETVAAWIAAGAPGPTAAEPQVAHVPADPYADGRVTYSEVKQIFGQRCIECHSANSKLGAPPEGLALSSLEAILGGSDRVALIPGRPEASEIVRRVKGLASPRMPLDGPPWLDDAQVKLLEDWIAGGALDDSGSAAPMPVGGRIRFRGVMTGENEIDGAGFEIGAGSRIDEQPGVGQGAELRGLVGEGGSIIVERLRAR